MKTKVSLFHGMNGLWVACAIAACLPPAAPAGEVVLQDNLLRVAFDANSGALTRLENKTTGWIMQRRPELGLSFRLHVPLPGRRDNFVLGGISTTSPSKNSQVSRFNFDGKTW